MTVPDSSKENVSSCGSSRIYEAATRRFKMTDIIAG